MVAYIRHFKQFLCRQGPYPLILDPGRESALSKCLLLLSWKGEEMELGHCEAEAQTQGPSPSSPLPICVCPISNLTSFFKSWSFPLRWGSKAVIFQTVLPVCLEICVCVQFIRHLLNRYLFVPMFAGINEERDRSWENV